MGEYYHQVSCLMPIRVATEAPNTN